VTRAIPIDVLRAFVAVVNARGFTRAAEELGRTQPTISLQVKRLEELIETPLFENSTRLTLTRAGEVCRDYGLRVLQAHDALFEQLACIDRNGATIRLGIPSDLAGIVMPSLADKFFRAGGNVNIAVTSDLSENLLADYRLGQLDIALAVSAGGFVDEATAQWRMPMRWVAAAGYCVQSEQPIRLVTTPENSLHRELAVASLRKAGRAFEIVCASADFNVLRAALAAGAGVAAMLLGDRQDGLAALSDTSIASLPEVHLGLFYKSATLATNGLLLASDIAELFGRQYSEPVRPRRGR